MADDPMLALLQQQLAGGVSLSDSVGQLAQSDPKLGQIAQLLAQRQEQLEKELADQELEERQRLEEIQQRDDHRKRAGTLRRHVEEMVAELEALRSMLDDVAAALGACPQCWGEQPECRWCRGRGRPGFMPPDPDGFDRLVMPAVRVHAYLHRRDTAEHNQPIQERSAS